MVNKKGKPMKKNSMIFFFSIIASSLAFAASSKNHEEMEAREYNAETCDRMEKNWDSHAKAWCTGSGGVDWNNTNRSCKQDGKLFTKVVGKITCNSSKIINSDSSKLIQNCEIETLAALGYTSGNKHNFCMSKQWLGGEVGGNCWKVAGAQTTGETANKECPRLWRYYTSQDGLTCQHLTSEDASKLKVCGK